jgi:hypothetical protein
MSTKIPMGAPLGKRNVNYVRDPDDYIRET